MLTALDIAQEIDTFEAEVELRRQGRIDERVFAETRLRRGYYGQRYDNGQRHDGPYNRDALLTALERAASLQEGPMPV